MPEVDRHTSRTDRRRAGRPHRPTRLLDLYSVRIMIGLVLSLGLVVTSFNLPIHQPPLRVGWRLDPNSDQLTIETVLRQEVQPQGGEAIPITDFDAPEEEAEADEDEGEDDNEGDEPESEPERALADLNRMDMSVLEFAEQQPRVEGGLGAYYLNIHYPEAAQQAGIQGRLVLEFVVEPDGSPSNIRILKPLHALLDSAAVQALRQTTFIPGRQNGEAVRVRMRLPVRFELINVGPTRSDSTRQDSATRTPEAQR